MNLNSYSEGLTNKNNPGIYRKQKTKKNTKEVILTAKYGENVYLVQFCLCDANAVQSVLDSSAYADMVSFDTYPRALKES
jgi:hypothetical protein